MKTTYQNNQKGFGWSPLFIPVFILGYLIGSHYSHYNIYNTFNNKNQIQSLKQIVIQHTVNQLMAKADATSIDSVQHLQCLKKVRQILKKIQYKNEQIYFELLEKFSNYFLHHQNYEEFIVVNQKMLDILQSKKVFQPQQYKKVINEIGYGYLQLKKYDKALTYYQIALSSKKAQIQNDQIPSIQNAKIYWNIGYCHQQKKDFMKAWEHYNKGLSQMVKTRKRLSQNYYSSLIPSADNLIQNFKTKLNSIEENLKKKEL